MLSERLEKYVNAPWPEELEIGVVDFSKNSFIEVGSREKRSFDLASLTKVFCGHLAYLKNEKIFTDEMLWLLSHEGGLPSWGRLSRDSWKEQILSYKISHSEQNYSDFSPLRLMLELEKKTGKK